MEVSELKEVDGTIVLQQDLGLYAGPIPIMIDKIEHPILEWKGALISDTLWGQIVSFMRWTYEKYKSEAQMRLFYNEEFDIWGAGVMPQYIKTGMSSEEIADHEKREEVFNLFDVNLGWREAGTVHHHCSMSAFQSDTDLNDEKDKNGLHITLGDMNNKIAHGFHARASFRKIMYGINPADWIETTVYSDNVSSLHVGVRDDIFPNEWKDYLFEKPAPEPVKYTHNYGDWGYGDYYWDQDYHTSHKTPVQREFSDILDDDDMFQFGYTKEYLEDVYKEVELFEDIGWCKIKELNADELHLFISHMAVMVELFGDLQDVLGFTPFDTSATMRKYWEYEQDKGRSLDWDFTERDYDALAYILDQLHSAKEEEEEEEEKKEQEEVRNGKTTPLPAESQPSPSASTTNTSVSTGR